MTYAGGKFVAVGELGATASSADGLTWSFSFADTAEKLVSITYFVNQYIAVGDLGGIFTSPDAVTWTRRQSSLSSAFAEVAASPTLAVAIGGKNVRYSGDGITWDAGTWSLSGNAISIAYGNNEFRVLASTSAGASALFTTDGKTVTSGATTSFSAPITSAIRYLPGVGFYVAGAQKVTPIQSGPSYAGMLESNGVAAGNGVVTAVGRWGRVATAQTDAGTLTQRVPVGGGTLNGAAFGNGVFVAVGDEGQIMRSTDGDTWQVIADGTSHTYDDMTFAAGRFVAMGGSIGIYARPLTSTDGRNWSFLPRVATGSDWLGSRFGGTGAEGLYAFSDDGLTWTRGYSGAFYELRSMAYGAGRHVAVGGFGEVYTSLDGGSWSRADAGAGFTTSMLQIKYDQNQFVATGSNGVVITSADGLVWTKRTLPGSPFEGLMSINYTPANGWLLTGRNKVYTSADGTTWGSTAVPEFNLDGRALYDGTRFVCSRTQPYLLASNDGLAWTSTDGGVRANDGYQLHSGAYGAGVYSFGFEPSRLASTTNLADFYFWSAHANGDVTGFVDLGASGVMASVKHGAFMLAPDRLAFALANRGLERGLSRRAAKNGNTLVAAMGFDDVLTSTDNGTTWQRIKIGTPNDRITATLYAFNQFYAFATSGRYTSTDGINWSTGSTFSEAEAAAFLNGTLVAVSGSTIVYSLNGTMASVTPAPSDAGFVDLHDVVVHNGGFLAVGDDGVILTSTDGITWENHSIGGTADFTTVASTGVSWVAAGDNGFVMSSFDGGTPVRRTAPVMDFFSSTTDGTDVLLGGEMGTVLRVTP